MKRVLAICKDPGGTNNLLPVLPFLTQAGCNVEVFLHAGGRGEAVLREAGVAFKVASNGSEVLRNKTPDLVITTMCAGGGAGRDLVALGKNIGFPSAGLQDSWGARINTDFKRTEHHPDLLCVNDAVGEEIVRNVWGISQEVAVCGYPRLDSLNHFDREAAKIRGKEFYGITDDLPSILYAGQIWHAGRMLKELVEVLNSFQPCHLLVSEHPRMRGEAPAEERLMWEEACKKFRGFLHTEAKSDTETISASDFVLGQYTTVLVDAAAIQIPAISMLYPEYGGAEFQKESGGVLKEFPLVTLGCCQKVEDREQLQDSIQMAITGSLGLKTKQSEVFRLDGKNAERTAKAILELL